jgi:hypothetical protein
MRKLALLLSVCAMLSGCGLPAATIIALGAVGVSGGTLGLTAYHDCKMDGGCKAIPLPP